MDPGVHVLCTFYLICLLIAGKGVGSPTTVVTAYTLYHNKLLGHIQTAVR